MSEVRYYTSDPGLEILLGEGPVINIVEKIRRTPRGGRGPSVLGLIGAVVDDRGLADTPMILNSVEELVSQWGGFKNWLGDGIAAAFEGTAANNWEDRGKSSNYWGNLYAQAVGGGARSMVLCVPNMEIRDSSDDPILVLVERTAPTESYTLPAGTRIKAAGGYMVATLEPLTWIDTATTEQSVRVRQVSDAATSPVDISTVATWVDTVPADTTVSTVASTVPESIDAAEVLVRYTAALAATLTNSIGKSITLIVTDRYEAGLNDALASHCVTAATSGFFRVGFGCPPPAVEAADAQGSGTDGVGRATLSGARYVYVHPHAERQFSTDSAQLNADDDYRTDLGHAIPVAFRTAAENPEANPARPGQVYVDMRIVGEEDLAGGQPVYKTHWAAGIAQPMFDYDQDTGRLSATLFSGILADGSEIADRRMLDFIYNQAIVRLNEIHKGPARTSDAEAAVDSIQMFLDKLIDDERLRAYAIAWDYDAANNHLVITLGIQLLGNFNVITLEVDAGTAALPEAA